MNWKKATDKDFITLSILVDTTARDDYFNDSQLAELFIISGVYKLVWLFPDTIGILFIGDPTHVRKLHGKNTI